MAKALQSPWGVNWLEMKGREGQRERGSRRETRNHLCRGITRKSLKPISRPALPAGWGNKWSASGGEEGEEGAKLMKLFPQKWMLPRIWGDEWERAELEAGAPRRSRGRAGGLRYHLLQGSVARKENVTSVASWCPQQYSRWVAGTREEELGEREGRGSRRPSPGLGRRSPGADAGAYTNDLWLWGEQNQTARPFGGRG